MNIAEKNDEILHKTDFNEISFHLKSISHAAVESSNSKNIEQVIENFLLFIMGNFGAALGFIIWIETRTGKTRLTSRGIDIDGLKFLNESLPEIKKNLFLQTPKNSAFVNEIKEKAWYDLCSKHTEILFHWQTGSGISGLAGLGKKISSQSFSILDTLFIKCFVSSFIPHLCHCRALAVIEQLDSDIQKKNEKLAQLTQKTELAHEMLNRQLYHLNTLNDTLVELESFSNSKTITETFLLMILGAFSAAQGFCLLINKNDNTSRISCRGIDREKLDSIPVHAVEKIIIAFLRKPGEQNHPLFNIRIVTDIKLLNEISAALKPAVGVFFLLDETTFGVIVLGNKIIDEEYSKEDQKILRTLANNYILFLKNALSFEIVENLNIDLEKRNTELNETINELKASRKKIKMLETVKSHFKSIITDEIEKSRKVSIKDILVILFTGLILGIVFNLANPEGIKLLPRSYFHTPLTFITSQQAKQKLDSENAIIIDARPANFFEQKHIKGAENLPLPLFDFVYMMKLSSIDLKKEIIIYGRNISKHYDEEAAYKLESRNHENIRILTGGIDAWQKNGFPTEP